MKLKRSVSRIIIHTHKDTICSDGGRFLSLYFLNSCSLNKNVFFHSYLFKLYIGKKVICKLFFFFHRFKFRATNVMGQFTDSDYSDPVKTLSKTFL